jgi:hypothetical protein
MTCWVSRSGDLNRIRNVLSVIDCRGSVAMPLTRAWSSVASPACLPYDPLEADIFALMATPTANRILKKEKPFEVFEAEPGGTHLRRRALATFQEITNLHLPSLQTVIDSLLTRAVRKLLKCEDVDKVSKDAQRRRDLH